jgi:hypothetical protein
VDDDHVSALERTVEIEARQIVGGRMQPRERRLELGDRSLAVIARSWLRLQPSAGSYSATSWPRAISSRTMPRRKCALPWFQSDTSE